jgi:hypothetical protein
MNLFEGLHWDDPEFADFPTPHRREGPSNPWTSRELESTAMPAES